MKFLETIESEFLDKLRSSASDAELARFVSEKVLASYRNGIKAGQKGETVKRDGKSRRPFPPKAPRGPFAQSRDY